MRRFSALSSCSRPSCTSSYRGKLIGRASKANAVGGCTNSHSLIEFTCAKRILVLLTPSAINRSLPRTLTSHCHPSMRARSGRRIIAPFCSVRQASSAPARTLLLTVTSLPHCDDAVVDQPLQEGLIGARTHACAQSGTLPPPLRNRWFADSPPSEGGLEPSVPL